jgi:hypothetical protein
LAKNVEVVRLTDEALPNAGFTAADLEWSGIAGNQARFFYQIGSSFPAEKHLELELRNEDDRSFLRVIPLTLKPGEPASDTLTVDGASSGRWTARLLGGDAFADDDAAALGLAPRRPVRVAIPAADGYFFQRCVEAFEVASGALQLVTANPEILLAKGSPPPDSNASLIFAPSGDSPFWKSIGEPVDVLLPEPKQAAHPILKNLDFEALRFEGARAVVPADGALVLAVSESGTPLIWQATVANQTAVVINLDPDEGDFFLSPWFPVIVHNAATALAGRGSPPQSVFGTGSVATIAGGATPPLGKVRSNETFLVNLSGHWQAASGAWFGGALLSEPETVLDAKGPTATALPIERGHPPLVWLLVLALVLLAGESLLYHRRKVG